MTDRNSIERNTEVWQNWDWSLHGEEWTPSYAWKQHIIDRLIIPYMKEGGVILEIGPGGGRWTEELISLADTLILVDLCEACITHCRQRFQGHTHIQCIKNDGKSLAAMSSNSIDSIFSFDVFVHIAPDDIASYVAEFHRVLKPGGIGVIHHAKEGRNTGWRSDMTAEKFASLVQNNSLHLITQFSGWDDNGNPMMQSQKDVFTVLQKPA
tara:strand:+ start:11807 stop:12436 length:630 start_codon:yes stop_codon:yes gene_type:complete